MIRSSRETTFKLFREASEYSHEWQTSIVNASGFLITVPLLAVLISFPSLPRNLTLITSSLVILSAILFAGAIFFSLRAMRGSSTAYSSLAEVGFKIALADSVPNDASQQAKKLEDMSKDAMRKWFEAMNRMKLLINRTNQLFEAGIVVLILSFIAVLTSMMTSIA